MDNLILGIIISSIFIIAGIQSIRIYSIARTIEFVIFSVVFLFLALDAIYIFGIFFNQFIDDLTFFVYMGLCYQLLYKVREITHKRQIMFFWIVFIITFVLDVFIWVFDKLMSTIYINFSYILNEILIIYVGIDYFISYKNVKIVYNTKRTKFGRYIWMFVASLMIIIGLTRLFFYSLEIIEIISDRIWLEPVRMIISFLNTEIEITFVIIAIIFVITVFLLPEMFMITKPQIYSIMKLYSTAEKPQENIIQKDLSKLFLHDVIDYLEDVSRVFTFDDQYFN